MKQKKSYDDDDGRIIADMSGVDFSGSVFSHAVKHAGDRRKSSDDAIVRTENADTSGGQGPDLTPKDERMAVLGVMKAALLIGLFFIAGLALVVGVLILMWTLL